MGYDSRLSRPTMGDHDDAERLEQAYGSCSDAVCEVCGVNLTVEELEAVRADVDFVEHGARGHLIRVSAPWDERISKEA